MSLVERGEGPAASWLFSSIFCLIQGVSGLASLWKAQEFSFHSDRVRRRGGGCVWKGCVSVWGGKGDVRGG